MTQKTYPIVIFADGASSGNPGPGGWGSIVAMPDGQVTELGGGDRETTNNRMELMAVIGALRHIGATALPIHVYTDSVYVIRGITQWSWGWRKKGWKTAEGAEVANQDLWKILIAQVAGKKIEWKWVRGHSGIAGNDRVDAIATSFSKGPRTQLYSGPLLKYNVPIHDVPENCELPEIKERVEKPQAFSYLSLLGQTPMRHRTWASCERRVKGQPGAKFKKALSSTDEQEILKNWGYSVRDVRDAE